MKNIYGSKNTFAIEYEKADNDEYFFEMWVDKKPICCFIRNGKFQKYKWNLNLLVEWFENNARYIITEKEFPLSIEAHSSIEFYHRSSDFDSDDMEEFDRWFDKRQEWYFRHSWFVNRDGSFLPEVFFRTADEKIEIEWDNLNTYEGITYKYPKGIFYVDKDDFCDVLYSFLHSCKKQQTEYAHCGMELDDTVYGKITELSEKGNRYADNQNFEAALECYIEAFHALPEPVYIWEAATWLFVAIGDMYFHLQQYDRSVNFFFEAQKCPDGIGNPFILARIGECLFEMGNPKSREYLLQAYMLEGKEIFSDVDPKYYMSIGDLVAD